MLLNELEETISEATRVPATRRGLLDQDKLLALVDQLRVAVPQGIREADQGLEKREAIINQALIEARKIRQMAGEEASRLVQEGQIGHEAEGEASSMMARAEKEASDLINADTKEARRRLAESDQYALQALRQLDQDLEGIMTSVRRGIEWLAAQRGDEQSSQPEPTQ